LKPDTDTQLSAVNCVIVWKMPDGFNQEGGDSIAKALHLQNVSPAVGIG